MYFLTSKSSKRGCSVYTGSISASEFDWHCFSKTLKKSKSKWKLTFFAACSSKFYLEFQFIGKYSIGEAQCLAT